MSLKFWFFDWSILVVKREGSLLSTNNVASATKLDFTWMFELKVREQEDILVHKYERELVKITF